MRFSPQGWRLGVLMACVPAATINIIRIEILEDFMFAVTLDHILIYKPIRSIYLKEFYDEYVIKIIF